MTKRRTTNLKTKNNQNCQKIELCGSSTTKELKKKHSSRLVGEVETGSQGREDGQCNRPGWARGQLVDWVVPHSRADKLGGTTGEQDRPHNRGFEWETKASKFLAVTTCGGCSSRKNYQPHRRIQWRDQQSPRMDTNPPTRISAPKRPNLLVGNGGSDWIGRRAERAALFPLGPSPTFSATVQWHGLPSPGKYLRIRLLLCNRQAEAKKKKIWPKWKNRPKLQKKN